MGEDNKIIAFIKKNSSWLTAVAIGLAVLMLFFGGFQAGRAYSDKHTEPKVIIRYEKGDTVKVEVTKPVPYEVIKPVDTLNFLTGLIASGVYNELFPNKDTVYVGVPMPTSEDTLAVVNDYGVKRIYNETFFDNDTLGKMEFHGEVQYNRLRYYGYTFNPVYKTITETKYVTRKYSPFIGAGLATQPSAVVQGGVFFDEKYGVAFQYNYNWKIGTNDFGAIFMYKF